MVLLFLGGQISYRWDHLPTHSFSVLVKHLLLNGLRQDGAHALVRVVLLYVPFAGKQCGRTYQRIFHDLVWGEWFVFCILWPCARCALPRPYPTYEPILGAYGWLVFCISWYMFVYLGYIWIYCFGIFAIHFSYIPKLNFPEKSGSIFQLIGQTYILLQLLVLWL